MSKRNEDLIGEARNINSSLRRTRQTINTAVLQTNSAAMMLEEDGITISDSLNEHKYALSGALEGTKWRIRSLKAAEAIEKYGLIIANSFLIIVTSYILLKRTGILLLMYQFFC